jgi:hypothetical protein
MAGHGPFLALVLPMLDMADPPPLPTPPMPAGASRIEAHTGWYLAADQGIEAEAGLAGAGYLVRLHDGSTTKRATLGTRASLTFFTPGESEMPLDRYWLGPFGRVEVGSELMGRHSGLGWGQVNRATLDLGLRSALGGIGRREHRNERGLRGCPRPRDRCAHARDPSAGGLCTALAASVGR